MMVSQWSWRMALVLAMVAPAALGFGAVYVVARGVDQAAEQPIVDELWRPTQRIAQATASASLFSSLSQGDMAKFVWKREPEAVGPVSFVDGTGAQRTLAEFKGRVILVNVWATWCFPCRKEMPALDKLQAALGSDKFEVVALSVDRAGVEPSRKFLESIKVENLKLYVDPTAKMGAALKVIGMPTTLLIDAQGREVGRLTGEAEWASEDAQKLIRAVIG